MADLTEFLLSFEDIHNFDSISNLYKLDASVQTKLRNARSGLRSSYKIDKTLYDVAFITSDIHADLVKLDFMLTNAGLVTKVPKDETAYFSENVRLVCDSQWTAKRTLFIIVGDLVDGKRRIQHVSQTVPDSKGNIELLLHAYLYNLRIQARALGSEIRFVVGNHDFHSVIKESSLDLPNFYDSYVHGTARTFFGSRSNRRNCLLPFYNCCPYLMLSLSDEIACVHGGFTVFTGSGFLDKTYFLLGAQEQIDSAGNFSILGDYMIDLLSLYRVGTHGDGYEGSPLWSRYYARFPKDRVCSSIDTHFAMVVVGHCSTGMECCTTGVHSSEILADDSYTKYNCAANGGCVLVGCENATGPHLAFVDIGLSRVFYPTKPLASRAEVLLLTHNEYLDTTRYFNTIVRKNIGGDGSNDEVVWKALPRSVGGSRKRKNKRRVSAKSLSAKNRQFQRRV